MFSNIYIQNFEVYQNQTNTCCQTFILSSVCGAKFCPFDMCSQNYCAVYYISARLYPASTFRSNMFDTIWTACSTSRPVWPPNMFQECVVIRHFSFGQGFDNEKAGLQWKFTSFLVVFGFLQGPNRTYSADGHDKLMDFMNNTFPLAVYGLQDVFSGYILYLKVWPSNSDPKLIARWYLEYLYKSRGNCSSQLLSQKGLNRV